MIEADLLARHFEENRSRLRAVAHRMLGSGAEAEDAVQDTWLRLSRSDVEGIDNLPGGSRPRSAGSAWTGSGRGALLDREALRAAREPARRKGGRFRPANIDGLRC
jgi:hypothetical protein